ncbi:MAG: hypothetical protein IPH18_18270 [Chitinophagaceae bacterium]|nr:hypothetical protein [Chitinophagaceae bacterium]
MHTSKPYSPPSEQLSPHGAKSKDFQTHKNEPIVVWVQCLGRPYIFKRKDFLRPDEDSDVPAELKPPEGADEVKTIGTDLSDQSPYDLQSDLPF